MEKLGSCCRPQVSCLLERSVVGLTGLPSGAHKNRSELWLYHSVRRGVHDNPGDSAMIDTPHASAITGEVVHVDAGFHVAGMIFH